VALENGPVAVSGVHRKHTRWEIRAGRYHIRVTGTRFSAGWEPKADAAQVTMHEGSVEVTGPGMKAPARVVTGQRLRANDVSADTHGPGAEPKGVVEDATLAARAEAPAAKEPVAVPEEAPVVAEPAQPEPVKA